MKSKISDQVQLELDAAQKHLREAVAFAARTESPFLLKHISEMVFNIEHIAEMDDILHHMSTI
tara:strand:+ start:7529 stop:7717 length:189 start_codon:yes stop_codon:yes gene_type:complete